MSSDPPSVALVPLAIPVTEAEAELVPVQDCEAGAPVALINVVDQAENPDLLGAAPVAATGPLNPLAWALQAVGLVLIAVIVTILAVRKALGGIIMLVAIGLVVGLRIVPAVTRSSPTAAPTVPRLWYQEGDKLVGTGGNGSYVCQGSSVSLSADGSTALLGGFCDNAYRGAAWVFTRNPLLGTWSQQGSKLVGTGSVGYSYQGGSVFLSADGNTALVGGSGDNSNVGAVWVFVRSGATWLQQGPKLVGSDAMFLPRQGTSVSLSADGNTALVGGPEDNWEVGAAWVYVRTGGTTWSQQGNKLVGTGGVGNAIQGRSVSISADGNTALVGGICDNYNTGAVWVFVRTGGTTWSQQGSKLVGTGSSGSSYQGVSVAISADGSTTIFGGDADASGNGAAWVFVRSGDTTWIQQGDKLVGTGSVGGSHQGFSVALSANGDTAVVGGHEDNSLRGAVWVFLRSGTTWSQQEDKLVGTGSEGSAQLGDSVATSADGNTALMGGFRDNLQTGAAWVFRRRQ